VSRKGYEHAALFSTDVACVSASIEKACTNLTLTQSSAAYTPPPGLNNDIDSNTEVVSTSQPPSAHMTFDTLEEAERHYKIFAQTRGFGIRYNYKKKSEVTSLVIRAALVCHKAGHQAKDKEDT
jgi:hypothetical protein